MHHTLVCPKTIGFGYLAHPPGSPEQARQSPVTKDTIDPSHYDFAAATEASAERGLMRLPQGARDSKAPPEATDAANAHLDPDGSMSFVAALPLTYPCR